MIGYLALLPALVLSGLMLGALGLVLSSVIKQLENFAGVMNFVIFPVFFASSALYPLWRVGETSPLLYQVLGIFLPLITTNCAVLGVALLNVQEQHSFVESAVYGFGAAVGFSLVLALFSAMRERIAAADVPEVFRGSSIALITAGIMSLAFMGFAGLIKV